MAIIFENSLGNLFMAIVLENSVRQSVAEEFSARSRYQRARFVAAFDRVQIAVQRRHEFRVETVFEGIAFGRREEGQNEHAAAIDVRLSIAIITENSLVIISVALSVLRWVMYPKNCHVKYKCHVCILRFKPYAT